MLPEKTVTLMYEQACNRYVGYTASRCMDDTYRQEMLYHATILGQILGIDDFTTLKKTKILLSLEKKQNQNPFRPDVVHER